MTPGAAHGLELVVAADSDRGIARAGVIPWRLPGDIRHFKQLTTTTDEPDRENAVIMGRTTWESLPERFRPLPGRRNVVLSRAGRLALARSPRWPPPFARCASSWFPACAAIRLNCGSLPCGRPKNRGPSVGPGSEARENRRPNC